MLKAEVRVGSPERCLPGPRTRRNSDSVSRFVYLCGEDDWNFGQEDTMIYQNGITMPPKILLSSSSEKSKAELNMLLTSIVVFNLGVAHHRYAVEACDNNNDDEDQTKRRQQGLALAIRLYESSYKLQRATGQQKMS